MAISVPSHGVRRAPVPLAWCFGDLHCRTIFVRWHSDTLGTRHTTLSLEWQDDTRPGEWAEFSLLRMSGTELDSDTLDALMDDVARYVWPDNHPDRRLLGDEQDALWMHQAKDEVVAAEVRS